MQFACRKCGKPNDLSSEKIAGTNEAKLRCRACGAAFEAAQREIVLPAVPLGVPLAPDRAPARPRFGAAVAPGLPALAGAAMAPAASIAPAASAARHRLTPALLVTGLALGFILSRLWE